MTSLRRFIFPAAMESFPLGIDDLFINALIRHSKLLVVIAVGREVQDDHIVFLLPAANIREQVLRLIVRIDPLEARPVLIFVPEGVVFGIQFP